MGWLSTLVTVVAGVFGIGASVKGAIDSKEAAEEAARNTRLVAESQAREFLRAAETEREIGIFEAGQIRRKAIENRSTQIAAAAHNGIVVGDGTSAGMVAKTMRLAKQDMLVTMYNAERVAENLELKAEDAIESGQIQASAYKAQGSAAITQGIAGVASGVSTIATALSKD